MREAISIPVFDRDQIEMSHRREGDKAIVTVSMIIPPPGIPFVQMAVDNPNHKV